MSSRIKPPWRRLWDLKALTFTISSLNVLHPCSTPPKASLRTHHVHLIVWLISVRTRYYPLLPLHTFNSLPLSLSWAPSSLTCVSHHHSRCLSRRVAASWVSNRNSPTPGSSVLLSLLLEMNIPPGQQPTSWRDYEQGRNQGSPGSFGSQIQWSESQSQHPRSRGSSPDIDDQDYENQLRRRR